jgi:hypothetical protein
VDKEPAGKIEVGMDVGVLQYRLTPWRLLKYVDTTGDDNPWYRVDSPFGGVIAPPTFFDSDLMRLPGLRQIVDLHPRRLLAGQEFDFLHPARPGNLITVRGKIADTYVKGSREYVVFEGLVSDEKGLELARLRLIYCWPME